MQNDDTLNAYHEAGHALVAHLLGGEVQETSLESEHEGHAGQTRVLWSGFEERDRIRRSAMSALAGPVAEVLWRGESVLEEDLSAWRADWDEVDAGLEALAPIEEREVLRQRWLDELKELLEDPQTWENLCRIADALEAHETLDQILLQEYLPEPR